MPDASERFIVKVQLPLVTTGEPAVLVYNEDRSIEESFILTEELMEEFDDVKEFWYAHTEPDAESGIDGAVQVHLDERAPWQEW